jgi:hypothetical protein
MPSKAKLVTRSASTTSVTADSIPKGSGLTNAEIDSNFLNLRDQSIAITDGVTTTDIESGETITFSGASVTGNTVTIAGGNETVTALTSSASITVNCALGTVFTVTLAHNTTFTLTNFNSGQSVAIKIKQDGTGGRTATFTGVKFVNGFNDLSTGADRIDFVSIFNDGTDLLGAINLNYA